MSPFKSSQKLSLRMWTLAAFGALAIHLGSIAVAYQYMQDDEPEDVLGTPAMEIGIELLAPHTDPTDLTPGPDVAASVASPKIVDQKEVTEPTDLPHAVPIETEDPRQGRRPD